MMKIIYLSHNILTLQPSVRLCSEFLMPNAFSRWAMRACRFFGFTEHKHIICSNSNRQQQRTSPWKISLVVPICKQPVCMYFECIYNSINNSNTGFEDSDRNKRYWRSFDRKTTMMMIMVLLLTILTMITLQEAVAYRHVIMRFQLSGILRIWSSVSKHTYAQPHVCLLSSSLGGVFIHSFDTIWNHPYECDR